MKEAEAGRILVADDDPAVRLMAQQALMAAGHEVRCAADGLRALEAMPSFQPDVLLLDVRMPVMDGFEVCKRVRRTHGGHLPVMMLTALDDSESIEKAYRAGASDFLVKPIQWLVLRQRLRHILRAARTVSQQLQVEARNQALLDAIPDSFILIDPCGAVLSARIAPSFEPHMSGPARKGCNLGDAFPSVFAQECLARLARLGRPQRWEWPIASADGLSFFETRLVACGQEGGLAIVRDITKHKESEHELHRARAAAEAASRAKSQFLDNMNHELRTPLNAILGMTELVLDTELNAEQFDFLSTAKLSAQRLENLISEVLDFSGIEAGEIELEEAEFDLQDALADALAPLAYEANLKGLDLACQVSPDVPASIKSDEARLRQILVNLAHNAVKFTESGQVVVEVALQSQSEEQACLCFRIRDTGVGIAHSEQRSIFESFFQLDGSTTREYGGVGLGLTVAARLVRLLNGRLWLDSDLGQGSTFSFLLPVGLVPSAAASPFNRKSRRSKGGPGRILLLDSDRIHRRVTERLIQRWGLEVVAPDRPLGGVRSFAEEPFQLWLVAEDLLCTDSSRQDLSWIENSHIPLAVFSDQPFERQIPFPSAVRLSKPVCRRELLPLIEQPRTAAAHDNQTLTGRARPE